MDRRRNRARITLELAVPVQLATSNVLLRAVVRSYSVEEPRLVSSAPRQGMAQLSRRSNVAQDYFRDLSRHSLSISDRRRPSASCQDRRVSATRPTGGLHDTGADDHAAAAADARRHE